jgi:HAMP domain-containing protein
MKLLLKFNLVFLLVFAIGFGVAAVVARDLLQRDAREEVLNRARLLMEKAGVVSSYTAEHITPLLETQMKYTFLPESIPSYAAIETLRKLQGKYPDYSYKRAMLNPTNPRDRALEWEADLITQFKTSPEQTEFVGERDTPAGRSLYIARPLKISNPACLRCHTSAEMAPRPMVEKYGPNNGFGWTMNEALGTEVVSLPLAIPLQSADHALGVVLALLGAVFLSIGIALNLMLYKLVIQPVSRLSALADRVSLGELDAPEFTTRLRDEIGVLAESFSRMRKSLVHAMKMLEG